MTRLCFIDTETTSTDPVHGELWEVAMIHRDEDGDEGEWLLRWRPDLTSADPTSLRINGYWDRTPGPDPEVIVDGVRWTAGGEHVPPEVRGHQPAWESTWSQRSLAALVAWVTAGTNLVGAVPSFDAERLQRWMLRHRLAPAWHYHLVDIEPLMAGYLAGRAIYTPDDAMTAEYREQLLDAARPEWSSRQLSALVGIDRDAYRAHTAMDDARWARDCYDAVLGD